MIYKTQPVFTCLHTSQPLTLAIQALHKHLTIRYITIEFYFYNSSVMLDDSPVKVSRKKESLYSNIILSRGKLYAYSYNMYMANEHGNLCFLKYGPHGRISKIKKITLTKPSSPFK